MANSMGDLLTIPEYFERKNVLITGGSGFLGLILIEKLLRSCPRVGHVYLLLRAKRNKTPEERIRALTEQELFDRLRKENPEGLKKLKLISGDVGISKLGLSKEDENLITSNVNIIYHVAASVRFDDHLRDAIKLNLCGTVELVQLALRCESLEVFVHTSTAYCNSDIKPEIGEEVYPAPIDWREAIELLDYPDPHVVEVFTLKYIKPLQNTYIFTKRLAEQAIVELCKDKIDLVIIRPSIVCTTFHEPVTGWTSNLNGPFALTIAGLMGLTSSFYFRKDDELDFVGVDSIGKAFLIATREKYLRSNKSDVAVYNATSDCMWKMSWFEDVSDIARSMVQLKNVVFYFKERTTTCWYTYYFWTLMHVMIALVLDLALKLKGKPPRLMRVLRTLYNAQMTLYDFTWNKFYFKNDNYVNLDSKLTSDVDKLHFQIRCYLPQTKGEIIGAGLNSLSGIKKYTLKECDPPPKWLWRRHNTFIFLQNLIQNVIKPFILFWLINKYVLRGSFWEVTWSNQSDV